MDSINLRQAVFTTKFILIEKYPIVFVSHNFDNDWQFLGEQPPDMADLMIVSFQNILQYDKSIESILSLPEGFEASREGIEKPWEIIKSDPDE